MDIISYISGETDTTFIVGIIVIIEVVKQSLQRYGGIVPPSWVWKITVIVASVIAGLVADSFTLSTVFYYAAGATLIYQTVKMAARPIVKKFIQGGNNQ